MWIPAKERHALDFIMDQLSHTELIFKYEGCRVEETHGEENGTTQPGGDNTSITMVKDYPGQVGFHNPSENDS